MSKIDDSYMIKHVHIKGFKCFENEQIDFSNLTIITGPNSSGKSLLIQAIFMAFAHNEPPNQENQEIKTYLGSLGDFVDLKNKTSNPEQFSITVALQNNASITFTRAFDSANTSSDGDYTVKLRYLSANRESIKEENTMQSSLEGKYCGIYAQDIANYYYLYKAIAVAEDLRYPEATANTLEAQVNYWLSYICNIEPAQQLSLNVDKITSTLYRAYYTIANQEYKPQNLGAGCNYLAAILTIVLLTDKNAKGICIIENPEIHLHPKAQSRLAEFFAFVAQTGRQIIIETHSEHLISKLRYCVYKKSVESSQVVIQYRQHNKFEKIEILPNGKLLNKTTGESTFPRGFFDATLDEIYEINSRA